MNVVDVVRILTIMTPFLAAIALRLPLKKMPRWQRQLGFTASTLTGLLALAFFLGGGFYSCTLAPGSDNCFWKGIAILTIIFASFILAQRFCKDNGPDQKPERRPYSSNMPMLIAAWAGFGLAENFMLMLVAWVVLLHSFYRWQEMSGGRGRFLVIRDDFADV